MTAYSLKLEDGNLVLRLSAAHMLEQLSDEDKKSLVTWLSCEETIIDHVLEQLRSGCTEDGSHGFWLKHEREAFLRDTLEPARFYAVQRALSEKAWAGMRAERAHLEARHWQAYAEKLREILLERNLAPKWIYPPSDPPGTYPAMPTEEEIQEFLDVADKIIAAGNPSRA